MSVPLEIISLAMRAPLDEMKRAHTSSWSSPCISSWTACSASVQFVIGCNIGWMNKMEIRNFRSLSECFVGDLLQHLTGQKAPSGQMATG